MTASLSTAFPEYGTDIAIDASDLPAYANGQRFLSKDGPERERYSDPDASWGHRSAVKGDGLGPRWDREEALGESHADHRSERVAGAAGPTALVTP